ncbi:HET-domain-containing protein [Hypomontagnella monticulosa]|nr:HET-domain-containing protein [Hypomontagnella monticulosa]
MWLLNTETHVLEEFSEAQVSSRSYAILSHVWGSEEISFKDFEGNQAGLRSRRGWGKIVRFCDTARKHGLSHAWIDTCCIDKRNSADLTEAINSMYRYYYSAAACFIYLEDVHPSVKQEADSLSSLAAARAQLLEAVRATRWISRGWTLQELLAPKRRCFLAADWSEIEDGDDLLGAIEESTGIDMAVLKDRDLISNLCVGERMKWASKRQTTREEDMAYSLMGLFNVNMPVMYGEGPTSAFKRLQREIMQSSFDMTIFAWRGDYSSSGMLAKSPADFADIPPLGLWAPVSVSPYLMTNVGLSIRLNITNRQQIEERQFKKLPQGAILRAALQCDVQTPTGQWEIPMIYLRPVARAHFFVNGKECRAYRRVQCAEWVTLPSKQLVGCPYEDVLVLQDEHYDLVRNATEHHNSRRVLSEKTMKPSK